jgi:hypothetical protein
MINGITNELYPKGGPSREFNNIPAWSEEIDGKIKLTSKGQSAIYLLIEGTPDL